MLQVVCLHSKQEVEGFCRRNPFLHFYALGDLDDFFWPHTTWFGLKDANGVQQLALFYFDPTMRLPTLLAFAVEPERDLRELMRGLRPVLPRRFHAHLTRSVADVFADAYQIEFHGDFQKMGLIDPSRLVGVDGSAAVALSPNDAQELLTFYETSYPGNWFVPRMLKTGFYFGIRRGDGLASVAGVHAISHEYKVAALGNITTRPDARGHGFATIATARLCQELVRAGIECIGLNVKADNRAAIACYEKLGFERSARYGEYTLEAKNQ